MRKFESCNIRSKARELLEFTKRFSVKPTS
jgi:hypothetical protein